MRKEIINEPVQFHCMALGRGSSWLVCQPDGSGRKETNLRSNVERISQLCEEIDPVILEVTATLQMEQIRF